MAKDSKTDGDREAPEDRDALGETEEPWDLELPWTEEQTAEAAVDEESAEADDAEEAAADVEAAAEAERAYEPDEAGSIPKGRVGRSAKLGAAIGGQATRYARVAAANLGSSDERKQERIEARHFESAMKMASVLGEMKGAAMKIGQMASFIDVDLLPPEHREIYQEQLAKLRSEAPAMPWEKVREVLESEYEDQPLERYFSEFDTEATAAASIGQVHHATLRSGEEVAVKIQYPGVAEALESDLANAGILVRVAKALAPGLDARAIAGEIRERVLEELDYEFEAQNQRAFARAYEGHPFIFVPKVHSRLSRQRVLVSDWVEGRDFDHVQTLPQDERDLFGEIVFRFCFGSIYHLQHFNADTHPGNYKLMEDGRVAFLDFGMTKRLSESQILLEQRVFDSAWRDDADALMVALDDLGFLHNPKRIDAERLMDHVRVVGGWYLEDADLQVTPEHVMKMIEATSDPRSEFYELVRKEALPADELMGRRMETGLLAVLGQLGATGNWNRIMREWVYADPPSTVLGEAEWRYFARRGTSQTPGLPTRA